METSAGGKSWQQPSEVAHQAERFFQTLLHQVFEGGLVGDEQGMQIPLLGATRQYYTRTLEISSNAITNVYQIALPLE